MTRPCSGRVKIPNKLVWNDFSDEMLTKKDWFLRSFCAAGRLCCSFGGISVFHWMNWCTSPFVFGSSEWYMSSAVGWPAGFHSNCCSTNSWKDPKLYVMTSCFAKTTRSDRNLSRLLSIVHKTLQTVRWMCELFRLQKVKILSMKLWKGLFGHDPRFWLDNRTE